VRRQNRIKRWIVLAIFFMGSMRERMTWSHQSSRNFKGYGALAARDRLPVRPLPIVFAFWKMVLLGLVLAALTLLSGSPGHRFWIVSNY
jgi:hypothetical protein